MIIVQGFIKVQASDFAKYRRRLAIHAARVRALDGCLQYSLAEDSGVTGLIWVSERWRDKAAQASHLAGDHMGEFNQFMKHMPMSAGHIASYQVDGDGEWLLKVGSSDISQMPD